MSGRERQQAEKGKIREEGNNSDESDEESGEWAYQCSGQDRIHIQS